MRVICVVRSRQLCCPIYCGWTLLVGKKDQRWRSNFPLCARLTIARCSPPPTGRRRTPHSTAQVKPRWTPNTALAKPIHRVPPRSLATGRWIPCQDRERGEQKEIDQEREAKKHQIYTGVTRRGTRETVVVQIWPLTKVEIVKSSFIKVART